MSLTIEIVRDALKDVMDPEINKPLIELNMIDDIEIDGQDLSLTVYLTTPACPLKEKIKNDVNEALSTISDIGNVSIKVDARTLGTATPTRAIAPGVKNFVAIASGKGGVGKSTTSVNIALALAATGAKVGLVDADIFGPSIPHMLGTGERTPEIKGDKIMPLEIHGLKVMSIGFFVPADQAVVWRGPMLHKAIRQIFADVEWGDLDYLILDLPPGTGDVQLSIVQLIPLTGALVVSTPQDVALLDVRKCLAMFNTTNTKIFGMLENMSFFRCPECGHDSHIFGKDGACRQAEDVDLPLLGQIPIRLSIREGGDDGKPAFLNDEVSAKDYTEIAQKLAAEISKFHLSGAKPQAIQTTQ